MTQYILTFCLLVGFIIWFYCRAKIYIGLGTKQVVYLDLQVSQWVHKVDKSNKIAIFGVQFLESFTIMHAFVTLDLFSVLI